MNNKGVVVTSSIFVLMVISVGVIFMFYRPIINDYKQIKNTEIRLIETIELKNAMERVAAMDAPDDHLMFDDLDIEVRFDGGFTHYYRDGKIIHSTPSDGVRR